MYTVYFGPVAYIYLINLCYVMFMLCKKYFHYLHVHHTHLSLVYVSRDTIKQMHLFSTIKMFLAFLKMNAYMHLFIKWSNAQSVPQRPLNDRRLDESTF